MGRLDRYRKMRDFSATAEPAGPEEPDGPGNRFVVQEHHATALHWDFRLERDGVGVSWAVPKGIPAHPKENRLAVQTEDHPLSYFVFAGDIPQGSYGAGHVDVWDHGTYETHEWEPGKLVITLHGGRVQGKYSLFRTGGRNWMLHRMDPPTDPDRVPMPASGTWLPAQPADGDLPEDDGWAFEVLWRGTRVLLHIDGGRVAPIDADGRELKRKPASLAAFGRAVGSTATVLDGVLTDIGGAPALVLLDQLWLDGHALVDRPYEERRDLLHGLGLAGPAWQTPTHHVGDGAALLAAAGAQGLAGVVAKRLASPYPSNPASTDWIRIRCT